MRYAGNLSVYIDRWRKITDDPVILNWLGGYQLPFLYPPTQFFVPVNSREGENSKIKVALRKLLTVGAISLSQSEEGQILSPFFLVPKPDGSDRFILNLKNLNRFLDPPHFKLEDYRTVLKLIHSNCFFTSIDLKDAYYLVPIKTDHKKYLKFVFEGNYFSFNCLPFGLCTAPFVFTKILKPVLKVLRTKGIICIAYLDDLLIISQTKENAQKDVDFVKTLLMELGFIINNIKSNLVPVQKCLYLGFVFDSVIGEMSLPVKKRENIVKQILEIVAKKQCSILVLAKLIGKLVAAGPATKYGWVYLKRLEMAKFRALTAANNSYNRKIVISPSIINDLMWWHKTLSKGTGIQIFNQGFELEVYSDASKSGWGVIVIKLEHMGFGIVHNRHYI